MKTFPRKQAGFSVVEVMVALVAGLIVVGAVLAFTLSSLRSNAQFIRSTRLTQELRTSLQMVSDELKRAGYDDDAISYVGDPASPSSPFTRILISGANTDASCIIYAYDRSGGTAGTLDFDNGEVRAFRHGLATISGASVGVIEMAQSTNAALSCPNSTAAQADYSTYPATCANGWCPMTDPRIVNIQAFRIDPTITNVGTVAIRSLDVLLRGQLVAESDVVRETSSTVKVRTDCVATTVTDCQLAPGA
jgi:Tfp pilus assembly protein PilW